MEGELVRSVSQIFYLGPSFRFMKSRKRNFEKFHKVTHFWHKIKTKA